MNHDLKTLGILNPLPESIRPHRLMLAIATIGQDRFNDESTHIIDLNARTVEDSSGGRLSLDYAELLLLTTVVSSSQFGVHRSDAILLDQERITAKFENWIGTPLNATSLRYGREAENRLDVLKVKLNKKIAILGIHIQRSRAGNFVARRADDHGHFITFAFRGSLWSRAQEIISCDFTKARLSKLQSKLLQLLSQHYPAFMNGTLLQQTLDFGSETNQGKLSDLIYRTNQKIKNIGLFISTDYAGNYRICYQNPSVG